MNAPAIALIRRLQQRQRVIDGLRVCEKTPTYCGRLQTPAAALRYVKIGVI